MNGMHYEISFLVSRKKKKKKHRRFLRLWPELGMLMTILEEKGICNARFGLFSSFVDHAVWVRVHIVFSFLMFFHQKFIFFILETIGIDYMYKFL